MWERGDHFTTCSKHGVLSARHDAVCRFGIAAMCRAAQHVVTVETMGGYGPQPNNPTIVTGVRSRPDVSVQAFPYGALETAVDATFSAPTGPSYVAAASKASAQLATQREAQKRASHPDLAVPGSTIRFRGLGWESEGHPGPDAQLFIREVAQKFAAGTADLGHKKLRHQLILYNRFISTWRKRISALIAEGTARAVWSLAAGRSPPREGGGRPSTLGPEGLLEPLIDARP
jgi:hypothetical protein